MKKISIVGVEGSGKTVLMSVLGEKYAMPDKHGLSLKAKEGKTFKFCTSIVAAMRKGEWPMPTMPGEISELEWELFRYKGKSTPKVLGNVNVLDFAGEVYRQAFGINSTVDESNKEDVEKLRRHVSQSDILIVLINLKDIIDGDRTHPRTIEMLWLSQSILDFAKKHRVKDVALVFSQADRYKALLEQSGGVKNAFKEFLPNVMYAYPNVSAFAISAVDGTRIDDSTGKVVPACDFATTGLDKLMLWIKDCISPRKFIMKMVLIFALAIITVAAGVLWSVYEKKRINMMNELKDKEFKGYVIERSDKGTYYVKWEEEKIPPGNKKLITLKEEGTYRAIEQGYEWVPGTLCARWVKGVPHERNKEIVSGEKEGEWITFKPGYSITKDFSLKWESGVQHPKCNMLKSCVAEGVWKCVKPGWEWVSGTNMEWRVGVVHPGSDKLRSSVKEDCWECVNPGWKWVEGTNVVWVTGVKNPHNNNLISSNIPDNWVSSIPGYIVKENNEMVWQSGLTHPQNNKLLSSSIEGQWECVDVGYKWDGGTGIIWDVGMRHPKDRNLISKSEEGEWMSTKSGYVWDGKNSIVWKKGLRHPQNNNLISTSSQDQWRSTRGEGWIWDGGVGERWQVGMKLYSHPHWVTVEKEGHARPEPGYRKKNSDAKGWSELVWSPGIIDKSTGEARKASSREGWWLKQVDCNICYGTGSRSGYVKCSRCSGHGNVSAQVACWTCRGSGKVNGIVSCPQCKGNGFANFKCNNMVHNMNCLACKGHGRVFLYGIGWSLCAGCGGNGRGMCYQCGNTGSSLQMCNRCGGTGRNHSIVSCSSCNGGGQVRGTETCSECKGSRQVLGKVACTNCGRDGCDDGKVWERD